MSQETSVPLHIVAVGLHGLRYLFEALAPEYRRQVQITLLELAYEEAVEGVRSLGRRGRVDAVVAAGSNGDYLRQHLDLPVVLVKVTGFDVMQGVTLARRVSKRVALVMYGGIVPELADFVHTLELPLELCSYETEHEARQCVQRLKSMGVGAVVAPGLVVDLARAQGLEGILLYSQRLVREALEDAVESARLARLELARRERLGAILDKLRDGVLAVDLDERIEVINPAMVALLGQSADDLVGRRLSDVNRELGLTGTLLSQKMDAERIQLVGERAVVLTRLPVVEQGRLTGAVLICQDAVAIERLDRTLRSNRSGQVRQTRYRLGDLCGDSPAVARVRQLAAVCARYATPVLLEGESGTGKEVVAQGIHAASARAGQPFIAVNCAAFPEHLLESELFGYVDGAFTGASRGGKMGVFEAAHTGTLFLDEIGEMPLMLQTRLLRVLQEKQVVRIGSTVPTPVDVRVIAATHRNLAAEIKAGRFRSDLFYRLNILAISLPALRERPEDLSVLIRTLGQRVMQRLGVEKFDLDGLQALLLPRARTYDWPGNVRELENGIERLIIFGSGFPDERPADLMSTLLPDLADSSGAVPGPAPVLRLQTRQQEAQRIREVLVACGGNYTAAAAALGVSRTTLWRRLKQVDDA